MEEFHKSLVMGVSGKRVGISGQPAVVEASRSKATFRRTPGPEADAVHPPLRVISAKSPNLPNPRTGCSCDPKSQFPAHGPPADTSEPAARGRSSSLNPAANKSKPNCQPKAGPAPRRQGLKRPASALGPDWSLLEKAVAWRQARTGKELAPSRQAALRQAPAISRKPDTSWATGTTKAGRKGGSRWPHQKAGGKLRWCWSRRTPAPSCSRC